MTTPRRSRLLTRITISPRRSRELEKAFRAEMRVLRQRLRDPHPRETFDQFADRLFTQLEATLERYEQFFIPLLREPARRGRRPSLAKEPNGASGRRRSVLAARVAHIALRDGRSIPDVAREVLQEGMRQYKPRRHQALRALAQDHQDHANAYRLSPARALIRAFSEEPFCRDLEALIRTSRNHAGTPSTRK